MSNELIYTPATPLEGLVLVQGSTEQTPFLIGGVDATSNDRTMKLVLLSVPSHGVLITLDQQTIQTGSILTVPWGESRIAVMYRSTDTSFFSLPEPSIETEADKFNYMLEAYDPRSGNLIGWSGGDRLPATQKIHVRNYNHPPELVVPRLRIKQTKAMVSGKSMAIISGVEVLDSDKDVNVVRVDLEAETGALTLNDKFRDLADFDSCRFRWQHGWRCVGSGEDDRKMTFLARPSHVKFILAEMEYTSDFPYQDDSLLISVFDGIDGECIADFEQAYTSEAIGPELLHYSSVQDGCYSQRAIVEIVGMEEIPGDLDSIDEPINRATALGWAIYMVIGIVAFLLVGLLVRLIFCGIGGRRGGAAVGPAIGPGYD